MPSRLTFNFGNLALLLNYLLFASLFWFASRPIGAPTEFPLPWLEVGILIAGFTAFQFRIGKKRSLLENAFFSSLPLFLILVDEVAKIVWPEQARIIGLEIHIPAEGLPAEGSGTFEMTFQTDPFLFATMLFVIFLPSLMTFFLLSRKRNN